MVQVVVVDLVLFVNTLISFDSTKDVIMWVPPNGGESD